MQSLPAGFSTDKIFFQPDKVNEAISSFMWNLVESVAIVILVLIFTMGLRSGLIIGFGLILTVAVSFPILLMGGTTLQRISLGAFIVAMGMLVDNAVVIMDGILIDKKTRTGPQHLPLSHRPKYRSSAARRDDHRRFDLPVRLPLARHLGRICSRPVSGVVCQPAGQLGIGPDSGAGLRQILVAHPRKTTRRRYNPRHELPDPTGSSDGPSLA